MLIISKKQGMYNTKRYYRLTNMTKRHDFAHQREDVTSSQILFEAVKFFSAN